MQEIICFIPLWIHETHASSTRTLRKSNLNNFLFTYMKGFYCVFVQFGFILCETLTIKPERKNTEIYEPTRMFIWVIIVFGKYWVKRWPLQWGWDQGWQHLPIRQLWKKREEVLLEASLLVPFYWQDTKPFSVTYHLFWIHPGPSFRKEVKYLMCLGTRRCHQNVLHQSHDVRLQSRSCYRHSHFHWPLSTFKDRETQ